MNSLIADTYPTFRLYQALRAQLIDLLADEDLRFTAPDSASRSTRRCC